MNIPKHLLDEINSNKDSICVDSNDMKYIIQLKIHGYIKYIDTTTFDTKPGCRDIAVIILKPIK